MGGILRAFIVMALLAIPVAAQAQGKIGVVNLDDALGNSSAGKAAFSQLKSRFESREKALASQGEELKRMQNDLQKASVALSADAKKSKAAEFETKPANTSRIRSSCSRKNSSSAERAPAPAQPAAKGPDRLCVQEWLFRYHGSPQRPLLRCEVGHDQGHSAGIDRSK
jgi:outer membrane protein